MSKTKVYLLIIGCCYLLFLVGCDKEYDSLMWSSKEDQKFERYPFLLPINFGEYNKFAVTKSSTGSTYHFEFNSDMLDSIQSYQKEVKPGVIYTETPLKGTLFCRTISDHIENSGDNIVPVKIFHIRKEFCLKDSLSERIITMIPSTEYYESNAEFSYLNMPGFTGTIITSSLDGDPIDVWGVKNGVIGLGEFRKDDADSIFASLEFFESPAAAMSRGIATKGGIMDDTLDACYVVVSYVMRNGFIPNVFIGYFEDPKENGQREPQIPSGGPLMDEDINTVYYTATIHSKFCNAESTSNTYNCLKDTELVLKAKSSQSDSCIFFCWKQDNTIISFSPNINIVMINNIDLTMIYQSGDDKECFELAQMATDTLLHAKIDSLRRYTNVTDLESGIAVRENGTYYQLTGGSESSIPLVLDSGTKYIGVYHTHPSNNCIPSGKDLCMMFRNLSKYSENRVIKFGIITDKEIMLLNLRDTTKMLNYFTNLASGKGHMDVDGFLNKNFIYPAEIEMSYVSESNRHMVCLQQMLSLFSEMGIDASYSVKSSSDEVAGWYNALYDNNGSVILDRCF